MTTRPKKRGTRLYGLLRHGLLLGGLLLSGLPGCDGRPSGAPTTDAETSDKTVARSEAHVGIVSLKRGAPEQSSGGFFGRAGGSFPKLVLTLKDMADEEQLRGVFVSLGGASMGLARAEETGRMLQVLRERKLPVVCHAHGYSNASMLLAARGCSEVWLSPAGSVDTVGLAAQLIFGRALLDKLDVQVDFLQVGKFKGASEPFTRDSASPEARKSLQHALGGLRTTWLDNIAEGRGKGADELAIEDGPHTPEAAKTLGLIDSVGFEADARKRLQELAGESGEVDYFGGSRKRDRGVANLVRLFSGGATQSGEHVALVSAGGAISMAGGSAFSGGDGISHQALSKQLQRLREDDDVRAVVLRIDSPGGSALASDLLWRDLMDLRAAKPLVISVGGMAASGGYYLACAGTKVVAERGSIIGSIGVVAGKLSFQRTLAEFGVNVENVPALEGAEPRRALLGSPFSAWDEGTKQKLQTSMEQIYELFLSRIAESRDLDKDAIRPYAEGRIMGGADAHEANLIDELGGLERAMALAIELGKLEADIQIRVLRPRDSLLSLLAADGAGADAATLERLEREGARRTARALAAPWLPADHAALRYAESMAPLLRGETRVVALPFALRVE